MPTSNTVRPASNTHLAEVYDLLASHAAALRGACFKDCPSPASVLTTTGRLWSGTGSARCCSAKPSADVLQKPVWEIIGPRAETRKHSARSSTRVLCGDAYENMEWEDDGPEGRQRHFLLSTFPLRDAQKPHHRAASASTSTSRRARRPNRRCARTKNAGSLPCAARTTAYGTGTFAPATRSFLPAGARCSGSTTEDRRDHAPDWQDRLHPDDAAGRASRPASASGPEDRVLFRRIPPALRRRRVPLVPGPGAGAVGRRR